MAVIKPGVRTRLRYPWMRFTYSVLSKKILHYANISFSAHAIAQACWHTTSKAFNPFNGYSEFCKYPQEWDFTAQLVWWHCAFAHLRGNIFYGVLETKIQSRKSINFYPLIWAIGQLNRATTVVGHVHIASRL